MYNIIKKENCDSVSVYRKYNKKNNKLRVFLANCFYSVINRISSFDFKCGARDFRLMSRQLVDAVISMAEKERFSKVLFMWVGFSVKWLSCDNEKRVAGCTKMPIKSVFLYSLSAITGFSFVPLYIPFLLMLLFLMLSLVYLIISLCIFSFNKIDFIVIIYLLSFSFIFLVMGINNIYISKIMVEVKNRPLYVVKEKTKGLEL